MGRKRILAGSIFIVFLIIVVSVIIIHKNINIRNDKYIKTANEGDLSRYDWMRMLCEQSGLTEYKNKTPYYEDVSENNTYFSYIQSAVEWDVLEADKEFEGDGYASGRFVVLTAMKTIGERKLDIYLETEGSIKNDTYIELAIEQGLIENEQLTEGVSAEEGQKVLERLKNLYFTEFWRDDYSDVVYQDGVIELSSDDVLQSNMDGSEIVVADNVGHTLEIGTVIVFEQENTKLKIAREIGAIDADGTLSLNPVELDQVVESLTVSDITELTFDDIVNYYEVEENTYAVSSLQRQQADVIKTKVFPMDINSKGFTISLSTEGEEDDRHLEIQIANKDTGAAIALPVNDKVKSDCEYSAEIDIDKILVGGQVSYSIWHGGLEYAEAAVDVESTFKGTVKTEEEKKILLCKTPVPLGNGIVGVDIQIYLVLSVEGNISLEAELPIGASLYYEKDKGLRNFTHEISPEPLEIEVNCDAGVMLRFEPTLVILGSFNVMDVEADAGVTASATVTTQPTSQVCADISISFPVITISVCGDDGADTIIGDMGLSAEWEIISSEDAPVRFGLHYECLPDKTVQFVEVCTYNKEKSTENDDKPDTEKAVQMNNTYYTRYKEVTGIDRPVFCFNYPDSWTITREDVRIEYSDDPFMPQYMEYYDEIVELTNDRGVRITYTQYNMDAELVASGSAFYYLVEYAVERVGESSLKLSDTLNLEELMVAKIKECSGVDPEGNNYYDDRVSYAVLLNDKEGSQTINLPGYYGMCSFYYPKWDSFQVESADGSLYAINPYTFIAEAPDGEFTEEEEKEIVEILSSFRAVW